MLNRHPLLNRTSHVPRCLFNYSSTHPALVRPLRGDTITGRRSFATMPKSRVRQLRGCLGGTYRHSGRDTLSDFFEKCLVLVEGGPGKDATPTRGQGADSALATVTRDAHGGVCGTIGLRAREPATLAVKYYYYDYSELQRGIALPSLYAADYDYIGERYRNRMLDARSNSQDLVESGPAGAYAEPYPPDVLRSLALPAAVSLLRPAPGARGSSEDVERSDSEASHRLLIALAPPLAASGALGLSELQVELISLYRNILITLASEVLTESNHKIDRVCCTLLGAGVTSLCDTFMGPGTPGQGRDLYPLFKLHQGAILKAFHRLPQSLREMLLFDASKGLKSPDGAPSGPPLRDIKYEFVIGSDVWLQAVEAFASDAWPVPSDGTNPENMRLSHVVHSRGLEGQGDGLVTGHIPQFYSRLTPPTVLRHDEGWVGGRPELLAAVSEDTPILEQGDDHGIQLQGQEPSEPAVGLSPFARQAPTTAALNFLQKTPHTLDGKVVERLEDAGPSGNYSTQTNISALFTSSPAPPRDHIHDTMSSIIAEPPPSSRSLNNDRLESIRRRVLDEKRSYLAGLRRRSGSDSNNDDAAADVPLYRASPLKGGLEGVPVIAPIAEEP